MRSNSSSQHDQAGLDEDLKRASMELGEIQEQTSVISGLESSPYSGRSGISASHQQGPFERCLRRICLRPSMSLRNQLLLSFGIVSFLSLSILITTAILIVRRSSENVSQTSHDTLVHSIEERVAVASQIKAESFAAYLDFTKSLPAILWEITTDRFAGYPDRAGYANDSLVPFKDMISGRNIYPLKATNLLPLTWEFEPVEITDENAEEHFRRRRDWYEKVNVRPEAVMGFQGACNPSVIDPNGRGYYPGCSNSNNDLSVGGAVHPTSTYQMIHKKVSDFANPVLKPLYEYHDIVYKTGIFFANSGAGAYVIYPGISHHGYGTYMSEGCDWLLEPNPLDNSKTIGTVEMVNRCHPNGTEVRTWFYNPLERAWCREQALDPSRVHLFGPYHDAFEDISLFTVGRAVYDRVTNEFIACTMADISSAEISREMERFKIKNVSEIHFVKWDNGVVLASSSSSVTNSSTTTLSQIDLDLGATLFTEMKEMFSSSYHTDRSLSTVNPARLSNENLFSMYPVPVPPKTYNPEYVPEYAILVNLPVAEVYSDLIALDESLEASMWILIRNVLIAGFVGLVVVMLCIYLVSNALTKPMERMTNVGDQILCSLGSREHYTHDNEKISSLCGTPMTEVALLTREFDKLIKDFSGKGTATIHIYQNMEMKNPFVLHRSFSSLYSKRWNSSFMYKYYKQNPALYDGQGTINFERFHWGSNVRYRDGTSAESSCHEMLGDEGLSNKTILGSPLLWWIVCAIAVPLLATMVAILLYVCVSMSDTVPKLVDSVHDSYVDFEEQSMLPLAEARAAFAARIMSTVFRDIHLLSRISGWIFFGALQKSESITSLTTAAEECKNVSTDDLLSCPILQNRSNTPCDCNWNHHNTVLAMPCIAYEDDSRYLQKLWWFGSNQDAWPNGDINFTSYPSVATSPENTSWWTDLKDVPGAELGFNATRSNTTFEMLQFLSALSMVQIPLFNYQGGSSYAPTYSFTALEESGIFSGFTGCEIFDPFASQFQVDETTYDLDANSKLCPKGKYGYDPRCTSWYQGGKITHAKDAAKMYVSPPDKSPLSDSNSISQTISVPIHNKDWLIGMHSMNFQLTQIFQALTQAETPLPTGAFPALILTTNYSSGSETVVGPGYDPWSGEKLSIGKSVLPYDECNYDSGLGCENLAAFQKIVADMQDGKSYSTRFNRQTQEGTIESVFWTFSPVRVDSLDHLSETDILRGTKNYNYTVMSLAFASPQAALLHSFESLEPVIHDAHRLGSTLLVAIIALTIVGLSIISFVVTVSVIKPVTQLLKALRMINRDEHLRIREDVIEGSMEVKKVHQVIQCLSTVLPVANAAFFSGDLRIAYHRLHKALYLFEKLRNEKAIGVANNNLGVTMISMYRAMKALHTTELAGFSLSDVISRGESYFQCAIDGGESALARINEEEGWSTNYLIFMQQLSNRYFNRGMFFLVVKDDHPHPEEALRLGLSDLSTAKDMDREVVDNGDRQGFKGDRGDYFELLLGRIKGVQQLMLLGYEDEWCIDDLFIEAFKELAKAVQEPGHILFNSVEPAGHMQRLDAALIEYLLSKEEVETAAVVAIGMLIEDDFVFIDAASWALKAMMAYLQVAKDDDLGGEDPSDVASTLFQYRQRIAEAITSSSQLTKTKKNAIILRECERLTKLGDVSMESF